MYIDTNREPSNYQDDQYVEVSNYSRLTQEKHELSATRKYKRMNGTWNWTLESEYRDEIIHLNEMIQSESGVH